LSQNRPRVLFLGQQLPWPTDSGAKIRSYYLLRELAREFAITGLCFSPGDGDGNSAPALRELAALGTFESFEVPQDHSRARLLWDHLRSLLTRRPYTVYRYSSDRFRNRVRSAADCDLVLIDHFDLSGELAGLDPARTVCGHHDVSSLQLERRARVETLGLMRWYAGVQSRFMAGEERTWCPRVGLNVVVSEVDRAHLAGRAGGRYLVVPNGVDTAWNRPGTGPESGCVFVGSGTWLPNRDAMTFLGREILPLIRAQEPDCPMTWVGRVAEGDRRRFEQLGIAVAGRVDDVRPFVMRAACSVVPLRAGTGTRIKILEAWALGKAVVSTRIGCEGLAARDGENLLVRDDPQSFAAAVVQLLRDSEFRRKLGSNARRCAEAQYDWTVIGDQLRATLRQEMLAGADRQPLVEH
jgi:glycosyltransferase involved in cell wall biosynthesis